jgi:hypothetical protein
MAYHRDGCLQVFQLLGLPVVVPICLYYIGEVDSSAMLYLQQEDTW